MNAAGRILPLVLAALAGLVVAAPARAAQPRQQDELQARVATVRVPAPTRRARRELRGRFGPQGLVAIEPSTGTPRVLGRLDGFLTPNSGRSGRAVALGYVRDHADAMRLDDADLANLEPGRAYTADGIEYLEWTQSYRGVPAIDSSLTAAVTTGGRLVDVGGAPRHALSVPSVEPRVDRARARQIAAQAFSGESDTAKLIIYEGDSGPRLGWEVRVAAGPEAILDVVLDATNGRVQRHQNLADAANATIYRNYPAAPAGGTAESVGIDAFLNPGATTLTGPNAHAFLDVDDSVRAPADPDPAGGDVGPSGGGNWNWPVTNVDGCAKICIWRSGAANSWMVNRQADATQVFWFVNTFHDHLENTPEIAFTNAAGNFETDDPLRAQSMDGAATGPDADHVNNANMTTYPDGTSPQMQMYLTDLNGHPSSTGFDSTVIYHEYTHGLVGRSITGASGVQAVGGAQGGAFNEATADWYALDYVIAQGLEPDTAAVDVSAAKFSFEDLLRSEPTDCLVSSPAASCPGDGSAGAGGYTYGDLGKVSSQGPEVHADGEIWAQTMWQLRGRLIAKYGSVTTGVAHARRLYTTAMRLAPDNPSFLDMRNAILAAGTAAGYTDADDVWNVFAARGMGYFASTTGAADTRPIEDFTAAPAAGGPTGTVTGTVTEAGTGTPQSNLKVGFTGHDSGLGPELSASTNASGVYSIASVPAGTYPLLRARPSNGLAEGGASNVTVSGGATVTRSFALRRNLAASASGGSIQSFTGADYTSDGCGPAAATDGRPETAWSADRATGGRQVTVKLPAAATVGAVEIDPTAGCGDDLSSSLGGYEVQVSADNVTFTSVAAGTFTDADDNRNNPVALGGTPAGTRYVRLLAKTPQSTSGTGAAYVDVAELRVFAAAGAPAAPAATTAPGGGSPPTVSTEPAPSVTASGATLAALINPNGSATTAHFEYGETTAYGLQTADASAGSATSAAPFSVPVSGLNPSTTYHYRVVAANDAGGSVQGADRTLTTPAAGGGGGTLAPTAPQTPAATPRALALAGIARPRGHSRPRVKVACAVGPATSTCEIRYAAASQKRLRGRLLRGARVLARGFTRRAVHGRLRLTSPAPTLRAGRFKLELRVGSGRRRRTLVLALRLA